jgi:hypothetical protein
MCSADRVGSVLLATAALLLLCSVASSLSVVVQNGFELHAALTSPTVNWILLADNVSICCCSQSALDCVASACVICLLLLLQQLHRHSTCTAT